MHLNNRSIDFNNISSASNSSINSNNHKKNYIYNNTYQQKSKVENKIKNFYDIRNDINCSNKINKTIIKIKKNLGKKRNDLKESELILYEGDIDYNLVSLKNLKETVDYLINKYKKQGYTCIKKANTKFKFYKGAEIFFVEIMKLGNGLLYYNINNY